MGNITSPLTARPTIYKGIEMRSRLEAWWAARFDVAGFDWEYEPFAFADEDGQYLPDFRYVEHREGRPDKTVYVEIKGHIGDSTPARERMEIIWASYPKATLILIQGRGERYWLGFLGPEGAVWCQHADEETGQCA